MTDHWPFQQNSGCRAVVEADGTLCLEPGWPRTGTGVTYEAAMYSRNQSEPCFQFHIHARDTEPELGDPWDQNPSRQDILLRARAPAAGDTSSDLRVSVGAEITQTS